MVCVELGLESYGVILWYKCYLVVGMVLLLVLGVNVFDIIDWVKVCVEEFKSNLFVGVKVIYLIDNGFFIELFIKLVV